MIAYLNHFSLMINDIIEMWLEIQKVYFKKIYTRLSSGNVRYIAQYLNMTVWILAGNDINFSIAAAWIRLHVWSILVCNEGGRLTPCPPCHYSDVIMSTMASQITSLTSVYSTVYSDADQRKHQSSASLAFVRGVHRGPMNSPHKWPVTRKMFPFDDVIIPITCTI